MEKDQNIDAENQDNKPNEAISDEQDDKVEKNI